MASGKKKHYVTTLVTGVLSISSYILLYTHQDWVTSHFTRGGVYALLPISTAFYFLFVHGAFTSCPLSVLGLRVAKKTPVINRCPEDMW